MEQWQFKGIVDETRKGKREENEKAARRERSGIISGRGAKRSEKHSARRER